jgi:exosortase
MLQRERVWLVAVLVLVAVTYAPTFRYLWQKWMEEAQYSLAFLVPAVTGYFTWRKWPEVKSLERRSSGWGLTLIVFALLLHLAGVVLDVSGPSSVSLVIAVIGGCLYFHGVALVKTLGFPLAYLVFMIPVPGGLLDRVGLPMQLGAAGASASLLSLAGLEVVRSGVLLTVEGNSFEVAQACSGMSSLVALIGVTAVFAYLTKLKAWQKWFLFLLSLPVALAANVVRITTIGLVGYQWGQRAAMDIYHDWSSPILFLVAVSALVVMNRGFECINARRTT